MEVFSIEQPDLMACITDLDSMTVWELLRRAGSASVEELAVRTGRSVTRTQALLERLVRTRLVESRPARKGRRFITYRVTTPEIRISFERRMPAETDVMLETWERSRIELFERLTQRPAAPRDGSTKRGFGMEWAYLGDEDGGRISGLLREIFGILHAARDRHARDHPDGSAPTPAEGLAPYAILFRLAALSRPALPEASVVFSRPPKGKLTASQEASVARGRLSSREREVAELLAKGLSRPEVAAKLRLSPHTVVSLSQRIYAKLGIRSRAELAKIVALRI
jgi:DNA-binding CsgD family transcriptional regulator/predicted transcriptional regulator